MHSRKFCIFNKWRTQFGREVRKVIRAKERAPSSGVLWACVVASKRGRNKGGHADAGVDGDAADEGGIGVARRGRKRSIPWVCSRKKCVGGCGRCMGHLRQRQLCIVYVLAWKWEMAKRRAARTCSLKAGDGVLFDRQKDQVFHAKIKRVTPEKTYDIVYMNSSNEKRLVKACPRSRLASKGDGGYVRMPREWASAFVDLAGLVRGGRGEVRYRLRSMADALSTAHRKRNRKASARVTFKSWR